MTRVKRARQVVLPLMLLCLTLILREETAQGVWRGAVTACRGALPALFPALVLSRLTSGTPLPSGRYWPLFLGLVCGFPVGALTVCEMTRQGAVDKKTGNRLLFCCCNTGPAFIIGFCGKSVLESARAGALLYAFTCLTAVSLFFLTVPKVKCAPTTKEPVSLYEAIAGAATSFLTIAGCVIFFSAVLSVTLFFIPRSWTVTRAAFGLFLEITGGMAGLSSLPLSLRLPLCAAGIGWAGLSVYLQSAGPVKKAGLSTGWYLAGRISFALILFLLSFLIKKLL